MSTSLNLTKFFETESPKLRRFLRRYGPAISPEDVMQDSFARLCAADPETVASPRAYLFQTARNLVVDHLRRGRATPVKTVADLEALGACAPGLSPEDALVAAENDRALRAALARLSAQQRAALTLRKIEGLPIDVVAERLGVSVRRAQRVIAQAIVLCQTYIAEHRDTPAAGG